MNEFCPISGLPILCKPEWSDIEVTKNYRATFQKIGDNILNHIPSGDMREFDSNIYYEIRERIIKDAFEPGVKIIDMKNYGNLNGSPRTIERIKMYHQLIWEQFRCVGYIVYNSSALVRSMYMTAFATMQKLPYTARVVVDYPAALRIAMDVLGTNKSDNTFLSEEGFFQRDQWVYDSADKKCHIEFMVSNDNIIFSMFRGVLSVDDLGFIRKVLLQIFEDCLVKDGFSIISDFQDLQFIDNVFRHTFGELHKELKRKFGIAPKSFYIYGANNLAKASFLLSPPLEEVHFSDSHVEALRKIRLPDLNSTNGNNIAVSTTDIEKLVSLIGSIAWESESVQQFSLDTSSPLKCAEEALSIVNYDYRGLVVELKAQNEVLRHVIKELQEARDLAQSANDAKSDFLANMSHELRTPLNGVIGMAEVLKETQLSEEQKVSVNLIEESGKHLLSLINDILDHARIESGKIVLEKTSFNCYKVVEEVIEIAASKAYEKQLPLITNISPTIYPLFSGDVERLKQVLLNFLNNAIKFTSEGCITVNVCEMSDNESYQDISFEIQDTGIGIDKKKVELLFNQFTQIDPSRTRRYGGTGLGLVLAKQLINLMDGIVSVNSKPGEGSCFNFSIPFTKIKTSEGLEHNKLNLDNKSTLIFAEIDPERNWYVNQLSNYGCMVIFSGDISEGVDQFINKGKPADNDYLIVIDPGFLSDLFIEKAYEKIMKEFPDNQFRFIFSWNSSVQFFPQFHSDNRYASIITKPVMSRKLQDALRGIYFSK